MNLEDEVLAEVYGEASNLKERTASTNSIDMQQLSLNVKCSSVGEQFCRAWNKMLREPLLF